MKKQKKDDLITDHDPFDGAKAVGCLLAGVVLLLAFVYFFGMFINFIRP